MEVRYANDKVEQQCTSIKAATKLFGGDKGLAISLHARINAIKGAVVIVILSLCHSFVFIISMERWRDCLLLM